MIKLTKLANIFDIHNGIPKSNIKVVDSKINDNYIFYIRPSQSYENSIDGYVDRNIIKDNKIFKEETIYISTDGQGSHSYSYVSTFDFVPNSNVVALTLKAGIKLSFLEKIFYAKCITMNRPKFNYSRKPKGNRLKNLMIPDINSIPIFVKKNKIKVIKKESYHKKRISLLVNWQSFQFGGKDGIFDITLGKPVHKNQVEHGSLPYITRTALNNGVKTFGNSEHINKGNAITIGAEGIIAFYQEYNFITGNNINIIRHKNLNKYIGVFLCTILNHTNIGRYNYGYAIVNHRLKNLQIKLPATSQGLPDFEFMENYIKSLPYSASL